MLSGFFQPFLKKICFSLSTSFCLNQNNSIIPVCRGIIPESPYFAFLVCLDPLVCFIWISEVIFGSLSLFSKYGKQKVLVAYSIYLLHYSNFSYLTVAGTKYAVKLCEQHSISDVCTTSFWHSAIPQQLFEISGSLFFTSSERIKYSLSEQNGFQEWR